MRFPCFQAKKWVSQFFGPKLKWIMLESFRNLREKMTNLPKEFSTWFACFCWLRPWRWVRFERLSLHQVETTFWNLKCKVFGNFGVKMFSKDSKISYLIGKFIWFLVFWRFREKMKFSKVLILPKTCNNDTRMRLSFTNVNKSKLFNRFSKFVAVFIYKKFEIGKNDRI